jgi:hypothetical protein
MDFGQEEEQEIITLINLAMIDGKKFNKLIAKRIIFTSDEYSESHLLQLHYGEGECRVLLIAK